VIGVLFELTPNYLAELFFTEDVET